jgi:RNA polymerase sigma-70 factor (ECF subfamily)
MGEPGPDVEARRRTEAFVSLLTACHGKLLGYLTALLGRRQDAEDVLQRASLLMWQKFDAFTPGTDFVAWGSTICFYEAKAFQRLAARAPFRFDEELMNLLSAERLDDLPVQERRLRAIEACLKDFPEADRRLLRAAYIEGARIAEMADRLHRAPQTLYNRLNQLRRALADCVRRRLAEEAS